MNFHYQHNGIWLWVFMQQQENDKFDPMSGHYTEPGAWIIEAVYHKHEDIQELLSADVISDIFDEFERISHEFSL